MARPVCRKATAVLCMDKIEPSLVFWRDRLGLAATTEVPGSEGLQFVILGDERMEVMLQTAQSLAAGTDSTMLTWRGDRSYLFIEVDNLDEVQRALGPEVLVPRHQTFYGAIEVTYREPAGHFVTFAQFPH